MISPRARDALNRTAAARARIDALIGRKRKVVAAKVVKRKPPKPAPKKMLPERKRTNPK